MNERSSCCYVCRAPAPKYFRRAEGGYSIYKCPECGLEYACPVPSERELEAFYADYKDFRADRTILEMNARANLEFLQGYGLTSESRILDYGAGDGIFVQVAGSRCFGVDWKSSSLPRMVNRIEDLPDWRWDFITLWGVLEHLTHPVETLLRLADLLEDGGFVVMTTIDAEGVIPYYYKPPEHLSYWTKPSFECLAGAAGFRLIESSPYLMAQVGAVYFDRLLSRTPVQYREKLSSSLPGIVRVPTNETRVVLQKVSPKRQ